MEKRGRVKRREVEGLGVKKQSTTKSGSGYAALGGDRSEPDSEYEKGIKREEGRSFQRMPNMNTRNAKNFAKGGDTFDGVERGLND